MVMDKIFYTFFATLIILASSTIAYGEVDANTSTQTNIAEPITAAAPIATPDNQAQTNSEKTSTAAPPAESQAKTASSPDQPAYCPLASELKRTPYKTWQAGAGWRGYEQTIVTQIQSFIGAQWTGIKIGKIICLYQGKGAADFPIALEERFVPGKGSNLIVEPVTPNWSAKVQGYRFCKSSNVADCPFFRLETEKTESGQKLYEQINYNPIRNND